MEANNSTQEKAVKNEVEPIFVGGQLAYIIRKAREDNEFFHYEKADAVDGLAAVRYLLNNLYPSDENYKSVKDRLTCIENSIYNLIYYIGLMESEDGNSI